MVSVAAKMTVRPVDPSGFAALPRTSWPSGTADRVDPNTRTAVLEEV
jgi:hypothetical protein